MPSCRVPLSRRQCVERCVLARGQVKLADWLQNQATTSCEGVPRKALRGRKRSAATSPAPYYPYRPDIVAVRMQQVVELFCSSLKWNNAASLVTRNNMKTYNAHEVQNWPATPQRRLTVLHGEVYRPLQAHLCAAFAGLPFLPFCSAKQHDQWKSR